MTTKTIKKSLRELDLCLCIENMYTSLMIHGLKIKAMRIINGCDIYYTEGIVKDGELYLISNAVVLTSDKIMYSDSVKVPVNNVMFIYDLEPRNY